MPLYLNGNNAFVQYWNAESGLGEKECPTMRQDFAYMMSENEYSSA